MLSIVVLKDTGAVVNYFNRDNYYTEQDPESETNSQWYGKGAEHLQLKRRTVDQSEFSEILNGNVGGTRLGKLSKEKGVWEHTPGWDLTFSAPKSYSILNQISDDKDIHNAHEEAVKEALQFLEDHASTVRLTSDGKTRKEIIGNLTVAMFRHDTSRALDPNDHTHCVIVNAVNTDRGWRSLDSKKFFDMKLEAGEFYRRCLARKLQNLGCEINVTREKDFLFEIKGVPQELIEHHSKRRKEILEHLEKFGLDSAKAASIASLETRPKKLNPDRAELKEEWRDIATNFGFDANQFLASAKTHIKDMDPSGPGRATKDKAIEAINHVIRIISEREASFKREHLIEQCMKNDLFSLSYQDIKEAIQQKIEDKGLIPIGNAEQELYTTDHGQRMEKRTIHMLFQGYRSVDPICNNVDLKSMFPDIQFSKGQSESLNLILGTRDQFIGVQGYAGTGKTFMLKSATTIAEMNGYTVKGMAASSSAARILGEEIGRETLNISQHIVSQYALKNQSKRKTINQSKELWFVDESSLASTQQVKNLMELSTETGARIVFIGDVAQKDSVEAGRIFYQLQKAGMDTAIMGDIKRQNDQELRGAVYSMVSLIGARELKEIETNLERDIYAARDDFKTFCTNMKSLVSDDQHKELSEISNALDRAQTPKERNRCIDRAIQVISDDVSKALNNLAGRISEIAEKEERDISFVRNFMLLSPDEREKTILVIPSNEGRDTINTLLRDELKAEGSLTGEALTIKTLVNKGLEAERKRHTYAYCKDDIVRFGSQNRRLGIEAGDYLRVHENNGEKGIVLKNMESGDTCTWKPKKNMRSRTVEIYEEKERSLQVGDKIRWRKNLTADGIVNNEEAVVTSIKGTTITARNKKTGIEERFNLDQIKYRHFDYGYTHTVDSAQGATYKNVMAICESYRKNLIHQKALYVVISRAKDNANIYTDNAGKLIDAIMERHGANTVAIDAKEYKRRMENGLNKTQSAKISPIQEFI